MGVFRDGRFCPLAQQSFQRITGAHGAGGIWGYRNRQVWKLTEGSPPVKLGALPDDVPEVGPPAAVAPRRDPQPGQHECHDLLRPAHRPRENLALLNF
ncbi:MAG: hypothetical protein WCP45_17235 [Verrucomicrobiota bacterium]